MERTLSIIKPDAVAKNLIGKVIADLENAGLQVVAAKMLHMDEKQAAGFYAVHKDRPFFQDLLQFMTSGPSLVMTLQRKDAIRKNREIMGATNPSQAAEGTIRAKYGEGIEKNAVHGSDSHDTAAFEIAYFFNDNEIFPK